VNSNFGTASLVLGEEVDFYSWQNTDAAGMEAIGPGDQVTPWEMKAMLK